MTHMKYQVPGSLPRRTQQRGIFQEVLVKKPTMFQVEQAALIQFGERRPTAGVKENS